MLTDRYGLPISTASSTARAAYVTGCDCVLSADIGAEVHLQRAVDEDPTLAVAHAALARAHFLLADIPATRAAIASARQHAVNASAREQAHVDALCLGMEGKPTEALAATHAHLTNYPRDAMVAAPATGVFGLIGFSGRIDREAEQVALLEPLARHYGDDWWFATTYAFALLEAGRASETLDMIDRAMAANNRNAHGAHTKAHALYELGEDRAALDYLDAWLAGYPREGLLHCHVSWHIALCALALGQTERAWSVYERCVHPGGAWGPALNIATDGPAFLWRAELAGQPRDEAKWRTLRDYVGTAFPKPGIAFVDVHHTLACVVARDNDGLARLVDELHKRIAAGRSPAGDIVPRLADGFAAFAKGDWTNAITTFEAARADTVRIGGSRAQRDLVENSLLAAYLEGGRPEAAQRMLAGRTDRSPSTPVVGLG